MNVHTKFENVSAVQYRDIDNNVDLVKMYSLAL